MDGKLKGLEMLNENYFERLNEIQKEKVIEKIARGLYKLADKNIGSYPDIIAASLQAPRGVICLITALSFYEATTEIPRCVDIAIPRSTRAYKIKYPPSKFYRFGTGTWKPGIK